MSDTVQPFVGKRGLAKSCPNGAVVEVFEGKDGTYLLLFTKKGRTEKATIRLSPQAFTALLAIGLRLFEGEAG